MKKMTVFIPLLLLLWQIDAQTAICYGYDAAGNRITRSSGCPLPLVSGGEEQSSTFKLSESPISTAEEVLLFPNPTTGVFQLQSTEFLPETKVSVFDALGRLLFQRQLGDGQFDLSNHSPGTYYIRIVKGNVQKTVVLIKSDR